MEDDVAFDFLSLPNTLAYMQQQQPDQAQQHTSDPQQFLLHQQQQQTHPQQNLPRQPLQQQHSPMLPNLQMPRPVLNQRPGVNINGVTTSGIPVLLQQGVVTQTVDNGSIGFCPSQVLQPEQTPNSSPNVPIQMQQVKQPQQQSGPQQQQMKKHISPKLAPMKKPPAIQQKPVAPSASQPGQIVLQSVGHLSNGDKVPQVCMDYKIKTIYHYLFGIKLYFSLN